MAKSRNEYPKLFFKTKLTKHMEFSNGTLVNELHSEKCGSERLQGVPHEEMFESYQLMTRVHSKEGVPYGYLQLYIPSHIFDADPSAFTGKLALRAIVAHVGAENISGISQTLKLGKASKEIADYLEIPVGEPIAIFKRIVRDKSNMAVHVGDIVYPGALVNIVIDMELD